MPTKTSNPSNQQTESSNHDTNPPICFPDTDVPMACLFIHFNQGYSLAQFLQDFPAVPEEDVQELLEWVIEVFKQPNLMASVLIDLSDREE